MITPLRHFGLDIDPEDYLRTEDARFSPSGRLLALAAHNRIILMDVELNDNSIQIKKTTQIYSNDLAFPHGVDFLSESVIVVANREGWVNFFKIPSVIEWQERTDIEAIYEFSEPFFGDKKETRIIATGRSIRCGPGSVRVHGDDLFVCSNYLNTVSKHAFLIDGDKVDVGKGLIVAREGLDILDGIAVSGDGRFIAVADAGNNRVVVFRREDNARLSILKDPILNSPHGLCFSSSGTYLYVSDAGGQNVHVFESIDGSWNSDAQASRTSFQGIDGDTFLKTRHSVPEIVWPLEGGLKGLDLDPLGRVLVGTCINSPLTFFNGDHDVESEQKNLIFDNLS